MSILFWTFAPLVALVLATAWAHWTNRQRGPADAQDSISEYERFCTAITAPRRSPDHVAADLERQPVSDRRSA
jgi:hypothetical protein